MEKVDPDANLRVQKRKRRRYKLDESVWAARKTSGNSKDYYEMSQRAEEQFRRTFESDWNLAIRAHGLAKYIDKATAQVSASRPLLS